MPQGGDLKSHFQQEFPSTRGSPKPGDEARNVGGPSDAQKRHAEAQALENQENVPPNQQTQQAQPRRLLRSQASNQPRIDRVFHRVQDASQAAPAVSANYASMDTESIVRPNRRAEKRRSATSRAYEEPFPQKLVSDEPSRSFAPAEQFAPPPPEVSYEVGPNALRRKIPDQATQDIRMPISGRSFPGAAQVTHSGHDQSLMRPFPGAAQATHYGNDQSLMRPPTSAAMETVPASNQALSRSTSLIGTSVHSIQHIYDDPLARTQPAPFQPNRLDHAPMSFGNHVGLSSQPITSQEFAMADAVSSSLPSNVPDIDRNDSNDPRLCKGYVERVFQYIKEAEMRNRPEPNYMSRQRDINPAMRQILVDWMVQVVEDYRLCPETLYLSVNYADRYLSRAEVCRNKLQLVGVTCLFLASKHEEIQSPVAADFAYISDNTYSVAEILDLERDILAELGFELTVVTTRNFLRRFCKAADFEPRTALLVYYLAELSLVEFKALKYPPSMVAAASTSLARITRGLTPWSATLEYYTRFANGDIRECLEDLHDMYQKAYTSSLNAIRDKYSRRRFMKVASFIPPPSLPPPGGRGY